MKPIAAILEKNEQDSLYCYNVMVQFVPMKPSVPLPLINEEPCNTASDSFFIWYNPMHLKILLKVHMLLIPSMLLNKLKISIASNKSSLFESFEIWCTFALFHFLKILMFCVKSKNVKLSNYNLNTIKYKDETIMLKCKKSLQCSKSHHHHNVLWVMWEKRY